MTAAEVKAQYVAEITSYLQDVVRPTDVAGNRRINKAAGQLYKMIKAAVHEMDRALPGRSQKGNINAAMTKVLDPARYALWGNK